MANKQGSSSVPKALEKGNWDKDKSNSNGYTNSITGEKLTATDNYIQKQGNTGWKNVSNNDVIR